MADSQVIRVTVQPTAKPMVAVMATPQSIPVQIVPVLTPAAESSDMDFLTAYILNRG